MKQFDICKDCDFSGVYAIQNQRSGKIYIGSSRNIKNRLYSHAALLKNGKHGNRGLLRDYEKGDCFKCYVVSSVPLYFANYQKDKLLREYEKVTISMLDTGNPDKGYNLTDTGEDVTIIKNIVKFKTEMEGLKNGICG